MADTAIDPQVVASQGADTTINELIEALRAALVLGRRLKSTTGLVFGYFGGPYAGLQLADGTITLTNNATNYIVVEKATGTVSASTSTTNWLSGAYDQLYVAVTASGVITSVTTYHQITAGILAGSGDVVGPGSSTDNRLARFDGVSGKAIQDGSASMSDLGEIYGHKALVVDQTGTTYTLAATDTGTVLRFTNGSAITVTLPASLGVGFECVIVQAGAGQITLSAASGASIRNRSSFTKTVAQYSPISLVVLTNSGGSAAEYLAMGDMA